METKRYVVEFVEYGWAILDLTIEDGENCCVGGSVNQAEAEAQCAALNAAAVQ